MKYTEYLTTAQRHLKSCQTFYNSIDWDTCGDPQPILRDLYYLTGYIFEAVVVYLIYNKGGFDKNTSIKDFDKKFTEKTDVDFFAKRRRLYKANDNTSTLTEDDEKWLKSKSPLYAIQKHRFRELVHHCIRNKKNKCCILPLKIPYLSIPLNIQQNHAKQLIDMWDVCLRYSTEDPKDPWNNGEMASLLSRETIGEILNICNEILKRINSVKYFQRRIML